MKDKLMKSFSCLCIILVFILVVLIAKKTDVTMDNYMILGERIGNNQHENFFMERVDEKVIKTSNSTFTLEHISSGQMLKMLQENVSKKINGEFVQIKDVIQKSNCISLFAGNSDFVDKIKIDPQTKTATYDYDVLNRQVDITVMNICNIVEEIRLYNSYCDIILASAFFPYYDLNQSQYQEIISIFCSLNRSLQEICQETNLYFLDIGLLNNSNYLNENTYTINDEGSQYLGEKIFHCAIDKIC